MAEINKTQLNIDKACERSLIHRDYIAHSLRWSHALKCINQWRPRENIKILDIGCADAPLLKMLYTNKMLGFCSYFGIDIRKIDLSGFSFGKYENSYHIIQSNVAESPIPINDWDIIACFEVLEHNTKENGLKILQNITNVMTEKTMLLLSTPCFNGSAAGNHVYEWRYNELKEELEKEFEIIAHYGTFISQKDVEPVMKEEHKELYTGLKEYYDSNFTAILLAPLYPEFARNVLWKLKLKRGDIVEIESDKNTTN